MIIEGIMIHDSFHSYHSVVQERGCVARFSQTIIKKKRKKKSILQNEKAQIQHCYC